MEMTAASPSSAAAKAMPRERRHSLRKWSGSQDALIHRGPGLHILERTGKEGRFTSKAN